METEKVSEQNFERFVVRKAVDDYWRAEEKVQLVLVGLSNQIPVTTLCKLNNVSTSLFYEWREKFIARGTEPESISVINSQSSKYRE
jgi:transposase-like protein